MNRRLASRLARGACLAALALTAYAADPGAAADAATVSRLTISLAPEDGGVLLARTVQELSDPAHARYGQHLARESALDLLRPSAEALAATTAWLRDVAGVRDGDVQQRGQFLHATVSANQSAALLQRREEDQGWSGGVIAADAAVRKHIRAVHLERLAVDGLDEVLNRWHSHRVGPDVQMPSPPPAAVAVTAEVNSKYAVNPGLDGCDAKITPACLRERYQMKNVPAVAKKRTILGIMGFIGVRGCFPLLILDRC